MTHTLDDGKQQHYRRAQPRISAPDYGGILATGRVLKFFALLWALGSVPSLLMALSWADQYLQEMSAGHVTSESRRGLAIYGGVSLTCLTMCALLHMAGLLGVAIRDMAQNTFQIRSEMRRRSRD